MGEKFDFNKCRLGKLPPAQNGTRDVYRDGIEPGLFLYVTRRGTKTFFLFRKFRGRPLRIKIGRFPDLPISAARLRAQELKGQLAQGIDPSAKDLSRESDKVTLGEIAEQYLAAKRDKLAKNTIKIYEGRNRTALKSWLSTPIASITKQELVRKHENLSGTRGRHMADLTMRIFGAYFEFFADRYDFAGPNPTKTLSRNNLWKTGAKDRRKRALSESEFPQWIASVRKLDQGVQDYLMTVLLTGMRKTETASMRWENIDFDRREVMVTETKNGEPLTVPMSSHLERILQRRRCETEGGYVFPGDRDPNKPYLWGSAMSERISADLGSRFHLHMLRNTFITVAESLDISPYTIKRLVNHKSGGRDVTEGYLVLTIDRLREPADRIAQRMVELLDPK